jgi:hypothetical protein
VQADVTISEEDEGGRGYGGLRHVEDADALGHGDGRALKVDLFEEAVHLARSDAFAALGGDGLYLFEHAAHAFALLCGEEEDGGVIEVFECAAELFLEDVSVGGGLAVGAAGGDRVPFVHDDDDGASGFVRVSADGGIAGGDALGGVDQEEGDVGGFEMAARHDDGELLGHEVGFAFAADSGGVDEAESVAFEFDGFVNGIAGGSGDGRDDGAGGAGEGIEQGGFADVGAADDGYGGFVLFEFAVGAVRLRAERMCFEFVDGSLVRFVFDGGRRSFRLLGDGSDDGVEEFADGEAVFGADGVDVADAEAAEVFGFESHGFAFDLVNGEEDGLGAAGEETGEVVVGTGELGAGIDDHDDGLRFVEGDLGLVVDFGGDEFGVVGDDAAGIHQAEAAASPVEFAIDAVAGDAGLVTDNGAATAGEAVEEGGFAHVGPADDGDEGESLGAGPGGNYGSAVGGQCNLFTVDCLWCYFQMRLTP